MAKMTKSNAPAFEAWDRPGDEAKSDTDNVVDTWLDDRVRALYESVLEEPLPDDMLVRLKRQTH
jgi:hypothetical protein